MKVSNKISNPTQNTDSAKTAKVGAEAILEGKKGKSSIDAGEMSASARVDLSSRAQDIKKARELASPSDIDEAKVSRLQKMIDAGEYKVNAEAIADRLLDEQMKMPN